MIIHVRERRIMTTYVNSQFAMKTGQGRHVRPRRLPTRDVVLRGLAMLAAFAVSAIALSGGIVLLGQAGVTMARMTMPVALVFLSGATLVVMALLAGTRTD